MERCWTCGTPVSGSSYTCGSCKNLSKLRDLQKEMESFHGDASERLDYIAEVQQRGFIELRAALSEGLSKIASAIEWGFGEISWQLQQQTNVLRGIDQTLKTPGETQANEWRRMAEELRHRGVMDESEEFYLKALELNRLDYRIYVGLAETYLQSNKFDKARTMLEKSLPHAPKKEIDYKSYSYRLIGHISACKEDYRQATSMLGLAIELSPDYVDGHYDRAQYCAQLRNVAPCLSSLEKAILARPLYYYLAEKEQNFDPIRAEVEKLLSRIRTQAMTKAKDAITEAESALREASEAISEAKRALIAAWSKSTLNSISVYENAEAKIKAAKDKVASGDYSTFLEAQTVADEAYSLATNAASTAYEEREYFQRRRKEKVKSAWSCVPNLIWTSLILGLIGGFVSCVVLPACRGVRFENLSDADFVGGFLVGIFLTILLGIWGIRNELFGSTDVPPRLTMLVEQAEGKNEFDAVLVAVGPHKIPVIKEVRAITGLGLKEAKDLVESAPRTIKQGINEEEATRIKAQLETVGATVEIR